jgi:hypothetical protein
MVKINSKNRFKLSKMLLGPFILPFVLICSYFSFGLTPAKAASNSFELEQSCKSDKKIQTTDFYKNLLSVYKIFHYKFINFPIIATSSVVVTSNGSVKLNVIVFIVIVFVNAPTSS